MSFRRRLLLALGSTLAVVFVLLGLVAWLIAYGWLHYHAWSLVQQEADEVASHVVTPGGRFNPNRYAWHEPHHRFREPRIDPYFVQVFDAEGRLLRASANIQVFPPGTYPAGLLDGGAAENGWFAPLHTFRAGSERLYYTVQPIRWADGRLLGYAQVARYAPGLAATLRRIALGLLLGLGGLLGGLLLLIGWCADRTLRPLTSITEAAEAVSPERLDRRVPVPPGADRETAQLAATLNTLLDRLEHAFQEMQRFTANAAHELQTPLTVLRGHVDVALRRPRPEAAYRETLRLLGEEIDDLVRMVRGLLLLARLDRHRYALGDVPVDLAALVAAEAEAFHAAAEKKGLRFDVEVPDAAWVRGVPELLREVVANVLDNAVKYTPSGGVQVRLEKQGAHLELAVTDTGLGIPAEALPHVTDRFYRAASVQARDLPGSGLGLSLVAQIVALHRGDLQIRSEPGAGTSITVTFPVSARLEQPAAEATPA